MATISLLTELPLFYYLFTLSLGLALSYSLFKLYYDLWLHPLSKYPGPFLGRITNLYAAYYAFRGDFHVNIHLCHEKYGKFVRYGPNRLLIDTATGMHDIYSHHSNVRKATAYLPMVGEDVGYTILTTVDKQVHHRKRKVVSTMLSGESFAGFESQLIKHYENMEQSLDISVAQGEGGENCPEPVAMHDFLQELTTAAVSEWLFGLSIEKAHLRPFIHALRAYNWRMGVYLQCPSLMHLQVESIAKLFGYGKKLQSSFEEWAKEYGETILRLKAGAFSVFQNYVDPSTSRPLTIQELRAEGIFEIWAGSETSATTMSALLFFLSRYPEQYQKLATEIRGAFASKDDIGSGAKLNACSYLFACIQETMRICPPTAGVPWREVESKGMTVDGDYIPEGVDIGICIYSIHHSETYFAQPQRFMPERWTAGEMPKKSLEAMAPFSIGPRSCPGRSMALLQISVVMARLVWQFDFKAADGEVGRMGEGGPDKGSGRHVRDQYQLKSNVTSQGSGPGLVFHRRQDTGEVGIEDLVV